MIDLISHLRNISEGLSIFGAVPDGAVIESPFRRDFIDLLKSKYTNGTSSLGNIDQDETKELRESKAHNSEDRRRWMLQKAFRRDE